MDEQQLRQKLLFSLEDGRRRLSQKIHESIGQNLFGIQMCLQALREELPPGRQREAMEGLYRRLGEVLDEVRDVSSQLHPSVLDDLGLVAAIRSYVRKIHQQYPIKVDFRYNCDVRLEPLQETALFRIFQEAIDFVTSCTTSSRVRVRIHVSERELTLTLQTEDGSLTPSAPGCGEGQLRLYAIKIWTDAVQGRLILDSPQGKGFCVHVRMPRGGRDGEGTHKGASRG